MPSNPNELRFGGRSQILNWYRKEGNINYRLAECPYPSVNYSYFFAAYIFVNAGCVVRISLSNTSNRCSNLAMLAGSNPQRLLGKGSLKLGRFGSAPTVTGT
jgi:hypothetical protein